MNSILESESHLEMERRAGEPPKDHTPLQAAEIFEERQSAGDDIIFVSELGWLAAASVTIASIAAGIV